jgi:hypothetical protein
LLIFKHEGFVRQHYVHPKCLGFSAFALDERICVHLIPHDFQGLTLGLTPGLVLVQTLKKGGARIRAP